MNYNDENNNELYSSYTDVNNNQMKSNNSQEKPYMLMTEKELNEKRKNNKYLILFIGVFFTVIGLISYNMYRMDKYEFYIKEPEVLLATNSTYQLELIPKNAENFDYKNYTYKVENTDIAEVDEYGLIKAKNNGITKVKVKLKNSFTDKEFNLHVDDVEVDTINFKENIEISAGESKKIAPIINNQEKINKTFDYESQDTKIASVDNYGNINAISEGSTKITVRSDNGVIGAADNQISAVVDVVIKKSGNEVQRVILTETSINIKRGSKAKLIALVTPINAVNQKITWKSDNENVSVDQSGNIVAKNVGTSTITATSDNGKSATCKVTVTNETVQVTGVSLNASSKEMTVGQQDYLIATPSPSNATDRTIVWSSSNPKIVSVTDGKITALNTGSVVIIAKSLNGKTATCKINVKKEEKVVSQVEVTGIELNITNTTLDIGGTVNLTATVSPNNATNKTIIWTSNNESVASVSNGTVIAKKEGTAVITAKSVNGKEASCVIIVRPKVVEVTKPKVIEQTDSNESEKEKKYRKALIEAAEAFYRKGAYLQYDAARRLYKLSPENISEQNIGYTNCSGYTHQVYYQTFGEEIPLMTKDLREYANDASYRKKYPKFNNGNDIIIYSDNGVKEKVKKDSDYWKKFNDKLINIVKAGDVVVTESHAMLIKGVNNGIIEFYQSVNYSTTNYTGGVYTYKSNSFTDGYEEYGTLEFGYVNYLNTSKTTKSLSQFLEMRNQDVIIIIRFINSSTVNKLSLTSSAKARLNYPSIEINKVGKVNNTDNKIVNLNGTIKYIITIKNNSNQTYKSLKVEEKLSDYVEFVSANDGGNLNGKNVIWNVSEIAPNTEKQFEYTVKAKNGKKGDYVVSTGKVGNDSIGYISNAIIIHQIGKNLSSNSVNSILNYYNNNKNKVFSNKSEWEFIKEAYKSVNSTKINNILNTLSGLKNNTKFVSVASCSSKDVDTNIASYKIDSNVKNIVLFNYYGVQFKSNVCNNDYIYIHYAWNRHTSLANEYKERTRTVLKSNLVTGDIVVYNLKIENTTKSRALLYVDGKLIGLDSNGKVTVVIPEKSTSKKDIDIDKFLRNLMGYNFVILRPSLAV